MGHTRRGDGSFWRNYDHGWRPVAGSDRGRRDDSGCRRRSGRFARGLWWCSFRGRWSNRGCFGLSRRGRGWRLDDGTNRLMLGRFLLLRDGAQHVSGAGDIRQVDFGLDLFFTVSGARSGPGSARCGIGAATEMFPHQLRFVIFQRTGVGFLLRDADRDQRVKNFLTLDFQLTGQIVNSNLTHPLSFLCTAASLLLPRSAVF
jgi:hypothetical protein